MARRPCRRRALDARFLRLLPFCAVSLMALHGGPTFAHSGHILNSLPRPTDQGFFGTVVSSAGDVNGDGYPDVIVGDPGNDAGGTGAGRAYVFYLGPGSDDVPDLILTGSQVLEQFGTSVSGAGDVNGDGYADVIVGAPYHDLLAPDAGCAYVFYGGPGADASPDLTLFEPSSVVTLNSGDWFGFSVAGAGDVNGDHYDDLIVGAPNTRDAGGVSKGTAYIFYGGQSADGIADVVLPEGGGATAGEQRGWSVAGAGDVDGDGRADVLVGAPTNSYLGTNAGRVLIYTTGSTGSWLGTAGERLGFSVSGAGDVNGDGSADFIAGAPGPGGFASGHAYIFTAQQRVVLTGEPGLGGSVSGAGDLNGDGYADVIVGVPYPYGSANDPGHAYAYYGGSEATMDSVADLTMSGEAAGDRFGSSVCKAGDVNGDGYADIAVGAPGYGHAGFGTGTGRVYFYTSRPYGVVSPSAGQQWVIGRDQTVRWLGADLADISISFDAGATYSLLASGVGGRDTNEFKVTAPGPETRSAKVRLSVSGQPISNFGSDASEGIFSIVPAAVPPAAVHRLQLAPTGAGSSENLGTSVAGVGDFNGDGHADFVAGAWTSSASGMTAAGRAYLYYGGPGADNVPDLIFAGAAPNDFLGMSVAAAGDVNGDGYADVIVGASGSNGGTGRAYVYFGGPSADAIADLTLTGATPNGFFGKSVAGAGDVNGDGYADVIVGAYGALSAYVYYGGPNPNAVADLTLTRSTSYFGYSVSGVGDVNGDGYGDWVVGAMGNDPTGSEGRAYLYYGGRSPDSAADMTFKGGAAGDFFGISVSSAGDFDGDGHPDLIIGATQVGPSSSGTGRAFIFFGGPWMDADADLILSGAVGLDAFGASVSKAGDVNGDGFDDVVVGAPENGAAGFEAGRAYVYYGGPGADNTPDKIFSGTTGDLAGTSVAGAGDINGDGESDVVVGANGNNSSTGKAYLYDCNRYIVTSPNGGEVWNVGALKTISWLGAEPANVWLSTSGGTANELLAAAVGGHATNALTLRVPHTPSKFAQIRITPANATLQGFDRSDSLFTIQTSVALLALLAAPAPDRAGAAVISWNTDPGPADLAGYRLEKASGDSWSTLVPLTQETSYTDEAAGVAGARYRLIAINGLNEELLLGETSLPPMRALSAWPVPYRGGVLTISFATASALGGGAAPAMVSIFDVSGRLVRTVAKGLYGATYQTTAWDGRDSSGRKVPAGIYFIRSESAGQVKTLKLALLR